MRCRAIISLCLAVVSAAVLSGCAVPPSVVSQADYGLANELFRKTCLASLPSFEGVKERASKLSLIPGRVEDSIYRASTFTVPEKNIGVVLTEVEGYKLCGIVVDSTDSSAALGKSLLATAQSATGGSAKQFPSSHFEYAVHLKNGSVMSQDVRSKSGYQRNIVLLSEPVSEDEVAKLIYN